MFIPWLIMLWSRPVGHIMGMTVFFSPFLGHVHMELRRGREVVIFHDLQSLQPHIWAKCTRDIALGTSHDAQVFGWLFVRNMRLYGT